MSVKVWVKRSCLCCVQLLSRSRAVSQLLQPDPGALGSRVAAVGRAGSAALCWGEKAVLESWWWGECICCSHHKSSLFSEEIVKMLRPLVSMTHCPTFMPVIYKLQHMGVCGIQLTFGNALLYEWCRKSKLSETPPWLYGNHIPKVLRPVGSH